MARVPNETTDKINGRQAALSFKAGGKAIEGILVNILTKIGVVCPPSMKNSMFLPIHGIASIQVGIEDIKVSDVADTALETPISVRIATFLPNVPNAVRIFGAVGQVSIEVLQAVFTCVVNVQEIISPIVGDKALVHSALPITAANGTNRKIYEDVDLSNI